MNRGDGAVEAPDPNRRRFGFREDALAALRRSGYTYVDNDGWIKILMDGTARCGIVEFVRNQWVVSTYKRSV